MHDTKHPAGQYKHGPASPQRGPERFRKLGDYIDHVHKSEEVTERLNQSKFSFDEWWNLYGGKFRGYSLTGEMAEDIWNTAQENK